MDPPLAGEEWAKAEEEEAPRPPLAGDMCLLSSSPFPVLLKGEVPPILEAEEVGTDRWELWEAPRLEPDCEGLTASHHSSKVIF